MVGALLPGRPDARQHRRRHDRPRAGDPRHNYAMRGVQRASTRDSAGAAVTSYAGGRLYWQGSAGREELQRATRRCTRGTVATVCRRCVTDAADGYAAASSGVVSRHPVQPRRQAGAGIEAEAAPSGEVTRPRCRARSRRLPGSRPPRTTRRSSVRRRGRSRGETASVMKSGKSASKNLGSLTSGTTAAGALRKRTIVAAE